MWDNGKQDIIEITQKLVQNRLVSGTSGNVSLRLKNEQGEDYVAITPSSYPYDRLEIANIAVVDMNGKQIEGNISPSIELSLHLEIYRRRNNVNSVIHTHSIYATAMAVAGLNIPPVLDDQIVYLGGEIEVSEHALPGSNDMVKNVVAALGNKNAVLMAHHGALATGNSLNEAWDNCLLLERLAKIYIHSSQVYMYSMGMRKIKKISPDFIKTELSLYTHRDDDARAV
jgi:L-fuculose-phosphate aldolase